MRDERRCLGVSSSWVRLGLIAVFLALPGWARAQSAEPALDAKGRFVAFESSANYLVAGDTNGDADIFVRDRTTGETTRVSVSSAGTQGNGSSREAVIDAKGRFVAFRSFANNLVAGDTNGVADIFVHDRKTGETTRVSVSSAGTQGNGGSLNPAIDAKGRFVAFRSLADNLAAGDTNGVADIFVHDRKTGVTTRISVSSAGTQGNDGSLNLAIDAKGRFVAFRSFANNLVAGDTNGDVDVFVHDGRTGETTRVSVSSAGTQGNDDSFDLAIDAKGRFVAFESDASDLVAGDTNGDADIFVHDRKTGETTRVSVNSAGIQGNGSSREPAIDATGRFVAFRSSADNLVAGDTNVDEDVFVHDRRTGETTRVSVSSAGTQGNDDSFKPAIDATGRFVAFESSADDLVAGDTNGASDVFVHDRRTGETTRVSLP